MADDSQLDKTAYAPYRDPDDFIREVTDRIWVDRDISFIKQNYEPDSIVHGSFGTTVGRQGVIDGSLMRIASTPARVGQAEDVVWEARGEDAFLSSHLVLSADSLIENGRVRDVRSRTIANCLYRRGRMVEEWVIRDGLALALQTDQDPDEVGRSKTFQGFSGSLTQPPPVDVLAAGDSGPRLDDFRPECELVLDFVDQVWNRHNLARVHDFWVRDLVLQTIGDRTVIRPDGYQRSLLNLLAPFPDAQFEIRDLATNYANRYAGLRIALTWKLVGHYDGAEHFGPLTGEQVEVLGSSQFLIQEGRLVREVRVYDEIALRAQINGKRGDNPHISANIY
ncbi:MAG TPA: ester cyclase [Propionibacteriaceae bacterium]|nr:ester cyclase [Propionibacteriaceae bacterium]